LNDEDGTEEVLSDEKEEEETSANTGVEAVPSGEIGTKEQVVDETVDGKHLTANAATYNNVAPDSNVTPTHTYLAIVETEVKEGRSQDKYTEPEILERAVNRCGTRAK